MSYTNFNVPDPGIRFFVRLSGFSKSTYLESTCYGEFLGAKNFSDKFCPGSGFALNQSFSDTFLNFSLTFIQNYQKLSFFISRISQNSDFGYTVRFLNKYIFGLYVVWGVSGCKNFPMQISSWLQFCPEIRILYHCYGVLQPDQACFFEIFKMEDFEEILT